jgi:ADP-heptose:LPS heptosyltransferase
VALIGVDPALSPRMARAGVIDLCGRLNTNDLISVVSAVNVIVAPDTGIAHLAEATKTKSVIYYTTVPPEARSPHYRFARTLFLPPSCGPCYHAPTCGKARDVECALNITPEMVWNEVEFVHSHHPPWDYRAPIRRAKEAPVQFAAPIGVGNAHR